MPSWCYPLKFGFFGKDFHVNRVYRRVIDDAVQMLTKVGLFPPNGCFVAGTLVHTKDGLKPIEQTQTGDWVLSQPEEGGEKAYKRVAKTFRFEDEAVLSVEYIEKNVWDRAVAEKSLITYSDHARVVVTPNHPFWVKDKGWIRAGDLEIFDQLQLENGHLGLISDVKLLYKHTLEGIAWSPNNPPGRDPMGKLIDLSQGKSGEFEFQRKSWDWEHLDEDLNNPAFYYRTTVYNFEVEDFHTYYVGTKGIWVHNTHCK